MNAAKKIDVATAQQIVGEVKGVVELRDLSDLEQQENVERFHVVVGPSLVQAQVAVSCLLRPEPGDTVLLAALDDGQHFVLAVLKRPAHTPGTLSHREPLTIRAPSLTIQSPKGVELLPMEALKVNAVQAEANLVNGTVLYQNLQGIGRELHWEAENYKLVSGFVNVVCTTHKQTTERSYRFVSGLDQVRAEHLDHSAEGGITMRAKSFVTLADDLIKMDGGQVHLG